jgi:hypothetical protein
MEMSPSCEAVSCAATRRVCQHFTEPEDSLPYSQEPSSGPIPSQINSASTTSIHVSKVHFNIFSHLRLGILTGLFPTGLPTRILYAFLFFPLRATCPAYLDLAKGASYVSRTSLPQNCNTPHFWEQIFWSHLTSGRGLLFETLGCLRR